MRERLSHERERLRIEQKRLRLENFRTQHEIDKRQWLHLIFVVSFFLLIVFIVIVLYIGLNLLDISEAFIAEHLNKQTIRDAVAAGVNDGLKSLPLQPLSPAVAVDSQQLGESIGKALRENPPQISVNDGVAWAKSRAFGLIALIFFFISISLVILFKPHAYTPNSPVRGRLGPYTQKVAVFSLIVSLIFGALAVFQGLKQIDIAQLQLAQRTNSISITLQTSGHTSLEGGLFEAGSIRTFKPASSKELDDKSPDLTTQICATRGKLIEFGATTAIVVGRYDKRPLHHRATLTFSSNEGLAQHRADEIARMLKDPNRCDASEKPVSTLIALISGTRSKFRQQYSW